MTGHALPSLVLAMSASLAFGGPPAVQFEPHVDHPTESDVGPGPGARTTVAGDVDGDGDDDVVITDPLGAGPIVMVSDGDGANFGPPSVVADAAGVGAIAAGDLDGDGDLDVAGRTGDAVVVLLGAGDASFAVASEVSLAQNSQATIAVFDVNGDDVLDIVTPVPQGIQTLLGQGDGTFAVGPLTPLLGLLSDLSPADLDGDEHADLAVVDASPLLQRAIALRGVGEGSFVETGEGAVGYGPEGVMAGDLNEDGYDDVVSVDSFSMFGSLTEFTIAVLLADGHGGLGPATDHPVARGPVSGAIADLNGDDHLDVVVSAVGAAAVNVLLGDGTGDLHDGGRLAVTGFPQTPATADLDHDGRLDLAVPGPQRLSVLRNVTPTGADVDADEAPAGDLPAGGSSLPATGSTRRPLAPVAAAALLALACRLAVRQPEPR